MEQRFIKAGKTEKGASVSIQKNYKPVFANPTPLASLAFGYYFQFYEMDGMLSASLLFIGGMWQSLAGVLHYYHSDMFSMMYYICFGVYFASIPVPQFLSNAYGYEAINPASQGIYLIFWIVNSCFFCVASFKKSFLHLYHIIIFLVGCYFLIMTVSSFVGHFNEEPSRVINYIAGVVSLIIGILGLYLSGSSLVNEFYGKKIFPDEFDCEGCLGICSKTKPKKYTDPAHETLLKKEKQ